MTQEDKFIISCKSWNEFWTQTQAPILTTTEKGKRFERLTQLYLLALPTYQSKLSEVWLLSEVPKKDLELIELPRNDEGIDLIAKTRNGEYWAIQSKFTSDKDTALNRKKIGTFISLTFNTCKNISWAVLAHTSDRPVAKHKLLKQTFEIGLDAWRKLDQEIAKGQTGWDLIKQRIKKPAVKPQPLAPKPHQLMAIADAKKHYLHNKQSRGRMIMPCGTGKSLTAFWVARALKAKTIIVAVPSLALIRQSLDDWTREFAANGILPEWACICSDDTVGNLEKDSFVSDVYETGIPTYRDIKEISAFLRSPTKAPKVIFTTYQSSDKLSAAARKTRTKIDLAILDEAHKTVGHVSSVFSTLLHDKNIKIDKRLFMTATERVLRGKNDNILSMNDDVAIYGARFYQLTFKQAINQKLITDYKIVTQVVTQARIREIVEENLFLNIKSKNMTEIEAQSLAAGIAIKDLFKNEKLKHGISFHRSIEAARNFTAQQELLNSHKKLKPKIDTFHISSKKSAGAREALLDDFKTSPCALISNARCLTEGIDVPAIDCILFADPKKSTIDIVQATGRALRKYAGKKFGYVVIPLIVPDGMSFAEFAETTPFKHISRVITALSTQDERIVEEFRAITSRQRSKGKIIAISGSIPAGIQMQLSEFSKNIHAYIWKDIGRINWRPFEEARNYVQKLNLSSSTEWRNYCGKGIKPADIPANPDTIYKNQGWKSYGDWLGTGYVAGINRKYRSFEEARDFARSLKLNNQPEWFTYCKSGNKPDDIPYVPSKTYSKLGWNGYGDWLGTGNISNSDKKHLPFKIAREYARKLGFKSRKEWSDFCKTESFPINIPKAPWITYANRGWINNGDWLGSGFVATHERQYLSFFKARAFARSLGLSSSNEWRQFNKSGKRPDNIPANPELVYLDAGWVGYGDWLGTGNIAPADRKYLSFEDAKKFVRDLKLSGLAEWTLYSKSGKRPDEIPSAPDKIYRDHGWKGYGDWLGTNNISNSRKIYLPFAEARELARKLRLKSATQWHKYAASKNRPENIPSNPSSSYKKKGWISWGDWLGNGNKSNLEKNFYDYNESLAKVGNMKLKSVTEWKLYSKSKERDPRIPTHPERTYKKTGWIDYKEWLGIIKYPSRKSLFMPFKEARKYVHSLHLTSHLDWLNYIKSNNIPANIPKSPVYFYTKTAQWKGWKDWLGY